MMTVNQKNIKPGQQDDFLRIQDLLYLCLARWKWFVLSLAVTIGAATAYLLRTGNLSFSRNIVNNTIRLLFFFAFRIHRWQCFLVDDGNVIRFTG